MPFGLGKVITFPSDTCTAQTPSSWLAPPMAPPKGGTQLTPKFRIYCPSGDQFGKIAWDGPSVSCVISWVWVLYWYKSAVEPLIAPINASNRPSPGCQATLL